MKYTLINTEDNSNPGDELLTKNAISILDKEFDGKCEYSFKYTEKPEDCIDKINSADICFLTTVSYDNYGAAYYDLIKQIKVPIISLTSTVAIQRYELLLGGGG